MARSRKRHYFRAIFRRIRFYLPLALLLLVAMVLFLPLSPPWLARWGEERLSRALGAEVAFERLELTLASATVEVFGVALGGGEEPFRVGSIRLSGSFAGLISGGGRWPAQVTLDSPSPISAVRGAGGGWELDGPGRTLLGMIQRAPTPPGDAATTPTLSHASPMISGPERTPHLFLREVELRFPASPMWGPEGSVLLRSVEIPPRSHRGAPLRALVSGSVVGETVEDLFADVVYLPGRDTLNVTAALGALGLRLPVPAFGGMELDARNLQVEGRLARPESGGYDVSVSARTGRFSLQTMQVDGERWSDDALEIRARGFFDPAEPRARLTSLRLGGEEVDVAASGEVLLSGDYPGEARLSVNRLPGAALALGRGELRDLAGVDFLTASTSPTLRLEASARGAFARPLEMEEEVSLHLAGWSARTGHLPSAVEIRRLDVTSNRREIHLKGLDASLEGLDVSLEGRIPVQTGGAEEEPAPPGALRIRARGEAREGATWLAARGLLPPALLSVEAPIDLTAGLPLSIERRLEDGRLRFGATPGEPEGIIRIGKGSFTLRDMAAAVGVEPAILRFGPGRIDMERVHLRAGGVEAIADLSIDNIRFLPRFDAAGAGARGDINLQGPAASLVTLGRDFGLLDGIALPPDLRGGLRAELEVDGVFSRWWEADYRGRLSLRDGGATIRTPNWPVRLDGVDADLRIDRDRVEIRRLEGGVADPEKGNSTFRLTGTADRGGIRLEGNATTHFEFVTALLARELADLVMEGEGAVGVELSLTPREALPDAPDMVRSWIAKFTREDPWISIRPEADLVVDYRVTYNQAFADEDNNMRVFPREFPVPMERIRGNAELTPAGVSLENMRVDVGSARDVRVSGHIDVRPPVRIEFDVWADEIDINEWTQGWGEMPWASPPVTFRPRWRNFAESVLMVQIDGRIHARKATFLRFTGEDISTDFHMKLSSRRPPRLHLANFEGEIYGGTTEGDLRFLFPSGGRPWLRADARFEGVDVHRFNFDLHEYPEEEYDPRSGLDGLLTGDLVFSGQLLNYPTYTGEGSFTVEKTSFIGQVVLPYARSIIRIGTDGEPNAGIIRGRAHMEGERIYFPEIEVIDPAMLLTASGDIDFQSRLNFMVSASVISQRLRNIPIIQYVGDVLDLVGKEAVHYYNLRGTLGSPAYYPVPRIVDHAERLGRLVREGLLLFQAREEGSEAP